MPKFCPNCGREISDKVKFCTECGVEIESFSIKKDSPFLPLTECFFYDCGVKTSKIYYCPLCGHDFCEKHKLHKDHYGIQDETKQQKSPLKPTSSGSSVFKKPYFMIAFLFVIAGVLTLAFFVFNPNTPTADSITTTSPVPSPPIPLPSITSIPKITLPPTIEPITINTPVFVSPKPTTVKIIFPQPPTGTIVSGNYIFGGQGKFTIDNTLGDSDIVSSLTYEDSKKTIVAVFIRKGTSFTITNILDGTYNLYVLSGENWDPNNKKFINNAYYIKFEDPFSFITTRTTARTWEVTIYPVIDGNAKTKPISKDDFPKL